MIRTLKRGKDAAAVAAAEAQVRSTVEAILADITGGSDLGTGCYSFSVPPGCWRSLHNSGAQEALALVMTAGEHRKRMQWADSVRAAAAQAGYAHDASGFVAPKAFVDRAQQ